MTTEELPQGLLDWASRATDDISAHVSTGTSVVETMRLVRSLLETAITLGIMHEREECAKTTGAIPMRLRCPQCHTLHIDEGEYATKPHKTHTCQSCGEHFQPALVPTVGVKFLPGCKSSPQ